MIGLVHELFRPFCHQLADRSPQYLGVIFPVCYRCAGFYSGFLAQLLYLVVRGRWRGRLPQLGTALIALLPASVLYVDGIGNLLRLWTSPDWLRAAAGAGMGLLAPMLLLPLLPFGGQENSGRIVPNARGLLGPGILAALLLSCIARPISMAVFESLAIVPLMAFATFFSGMAIVLLRPARL